MKVALFGASGQLGSALTRIAARTDTIVAAFDRESADITDERAVERAIAACSPDLIINAAAYTAVDKAESDEARAFAINRDGVKILAAQKRPLIHISTDYVFDGTKHGTYDEADPVAPLGVYGRSKEAGEREAIGKALILRTSWVYGIEGANFVKTMLRLGADREVIKVVNDQRGCPTFADDLASAILTIALKYQPGLYHLAATGEASWYEFAREIFAMRDRPRVEPISTREYPTPARRPANSVLNCARAKKDFGVELPHWKDGLQRMLSDLQ